MNSSSVARGIAAVVMRARLATEPQWQPMVVMVQKLTKATRDQTLDKLIEFWESRQPPEAVLTWAMQTAMDSGATVEDIRVITEEFDKADRAVGHGSGVNMRTIPVNLDRFRKPRGQTTVAECREDPNWYPLREAVCLVTGWSTEAAETKLVELYNGGATPNDIVQWIMSYLPGTAANEKSMTALPEINHTPKTSGLLN